VATCGEIVQCKLWQMKREQLASKRSRFVVSDAANNTTTRLVVEAHPAAATNSSSTRLAPRPQFSKTGRRDESLKPETDVGVDRGSASRVHDDDESGRETGGKTRGGPCHSRSDSDLHKSVSYFGFRFITAYN